LPTLFSGLMLALSLFGAGCLQSNGDRCEVDRDCQSGTCIACNSDPQNKYCSDPLNPVCPSGLSGIGGASAGSGAGGSGGEDGATSDASDASDASTDVEADSPADAPATD
jgi:hypothetical protein